MKIHYQDYDETCPAVGTEDVCLELGAVDPGYIAVLPRLNPKGGAEDQIRVEAHHSVSAYESANCHQDVHRSAQGNPAAGNNAYQEIRNDDKDLMNRPLEGLAGIDRLEHRTVNIDSHETNDQQIGKNPVWPFTAAPVDEYRGDTHESRNNVFRTHRSSGNLNRIMRNCSAHNHCGQRKC